MPEKILDKTGKILLLGNEAIVRGALESGVGLASTYPGTPSSEIGDTFAKIAKKAGIYFEYSTNEKVALEVAAGAAFSGVRSIVSMKHYGVNVASDSLMPIAYVGVDTGLVIVTADDPNCWSSAQSEQDTRYYARMAHVPMIEPSDSQECKDFTKTAFELSEKFKIPIFLRTTTRINHTRGIVELDEIKKGKTIGKFVKDLEKYNTLPPHTMEMHDRILGKIEKFREFSEKSDMNQILNKDTESKLGIIVSGVSFNYVMDALDELKTKVPVFKLGITYPLPHEKISEFIKNLESVLVVEELEPIIEEKVNQLAKGINPGLKVFGKGTLPKSGEFRVESLVKALGKTTGKKVDLDNHMKKVEKLNPPKRSPVLCAGCPHRATFYAAKLAAGKDTIFGGDIGCYLLGIFPPLKTQDFMFSMGASEGIIHGIKKATGQKAISFLGDSTFFHAGIPGLINMVFNKSDPLVIVLDNRYTAMTGHQPHPGTGRTGMGEETKHVLIEDVARGCSVKDVRVVDPFDLQNTMKTIREMLKNDEVSVLVAKRECQLMAVKRMRRAGIEIPKYRIDHDACKKCGTCLYQLGCPAILKKGNDFIIDEDFCTGCGLCAQACPNNAIKKVKG